MGQTSRALTLLCPSRRKQVPRPPHQEPPCEWFAFITHHVPIIHLIIHLSMSGLGSRLNSPSGILSYSSIFLLSAVSSTFQALHKLCCTTLRRLPLVQSGSRPRCMLQRHHPSEGARVVSSGGSRSTAPGKPDEGKSVEMEQRQSWETFSGHTGRPES